MHPASPIVGHALNRLEVFDHPSDDDFYLEIEATHYNVAVKARVMAFDEVSETWLARGETDRPEEIANWMKQFGASVPMNG
jgi:hypothetical protein